MCVPGLGVPREDQYYLGIGSSLVVWTIVAGGTCNTGVGHCRATPYISNSTLSVLFKGHNIYNREDRY